MIFGCIWSLWHVPLFWIPGTYQYGLKEMGIMYVINFLLSVIPLDFLQTWVYVKNNRSMLAAIIIVVINKEMFFETKHVGNLLEEKIMKKGINKSIVNL